MGSDTDLAESKDSITVATAPPSAEIKNGGRRPPSRVKFESAVLPTAMPLHCVPVADEERYLSLLFPDRRIPIREEVSDETNTSYGQ